MNLTVAPPRSWPAPSKPCALIDGQIHVWNAPLDCDSGVLCRLETTLSPDEKCRAGRFRFARDRNRFVAARGFLRELLGMYLDTSPAELAFTHGPHGKPSLRAAKESDAPPLSFNVSHSHDLAVYAVARERNIGVDVERVDASCPALNIAERYFSPLELNDLRSLPANERAQAFFLCWTRKEAYVKARGTGLGIPLDSFHVTVSPNSPSKFLGGVDRRWRLATFVPADDYVAAIVYDGSPCRIEYFPPKS